LTIKDITMPHIFDKHPLLPINYDVKYRMGKDANEV